MSPPTAKFDVGGTVFKVAVSTIQSQPDGLLAKMIDGRFPCGKDDDSGAYFVDRNPEFFNIVLDVHRDNNVYPLPPGMTRERVVAELEFYGLQQGFDGVTIKRSFKSMLLDHLVLSSDISEWQKEQERLGKDLLDEGFARLFLAKVELPTELAPAILMHPLQLDKLLAIDRSCRIYPNAEIKVHIVKSFEDWGTKVTIDDSNIYQLKINLEVDEPGAGA